MDSVSWLQAAHNKNRLSGSNEFYQVHKVLLIPTKALLISLNVHLDNSTKHIKYLEKQYLASHLVYPILMINSKLVWKQRCKCRARSFQGWHFCQHLTAEVACLVPAIMQIQYSSVKIKLICLCIYQGIVWISIYFYCYY